MTDFNTTSFFLSSQRLDSCVRTSKLNTSFAGCSDNTVNLSSNFYFIKLVHSMVRSWRFWKEKSWLFAWASDWCKVRPKVSIKLPDWLRHEMDYNFLTFVRAAYSPCGMERQKYREAMTIIYTYTKIIYYIAIVYIYIIIGGYYRPIFSSLYTVVLAFHINYRDTVCAR